MLLYYKLIDIIKERWLLWEKRKSEDFTRIIKKKNGFSSGLFIIDIEKNKKDKTLFGITFVHNIGKAVVRNKLKRRTKAIIDNNKNSFEKGLNYIIIIKKEAITASFKELEKDLLKLFLKIKEKNNE